MNRVLCVLCFMVSMVLPFKASAQQCDEITVPWYEDFDTVPASMSAGCWRVYGDGAVSVTGGQLVANLSVDEYVLLSLPAVALPPDSVWFRFHTRYSGNVVFVYGVMTDTTDTNSFVAIDTVPLEANSSLYEIEFSTMGFPLSDTVRLAFKAYTSTYATVYLDNFYIDRAADCPMPEEVWVSYVDTTSVILQWPYNAISAGYVLTIDDTLEYHVTDTMLTIDSLLPNHQYRYVLQGVCYSGYRTPRQNGSFRTTCLPFALPYSEDFSGCGFDVVPECWQVARGWQQVDALTYTPSTFSLGLDTVLCFKSVSDTEILIVTPMLSYPGNRLHVGFDMILNINTSMTVGVMTDPYDYYTFTPTVTFYGEEEMMVWQHYEAYTESVYDSAYAYLAFRWNAPTPGYTAYIDDITVVATDSCHNPMNVHYSNVQQNSITVEWIDHSVDPHGYEVRYGLVDNIDSASAVFYTDDTVFYADSLRVNTAYWFWVRAMCNDTMEWVSLGMVRTVCGVLELPYAENFESFESFEIVPCWDYYHTDQNASHPQVYSNSNYSHSGFKVWTFSTPFYDTALVVLPQFAERTRNLEVSFWLCVYRGHFEVGLYDMATGIFTPVKSWEGSVSWNLNMEQYVFQCDTIDFVGDYSRVAFKWHSGASMSVSNQAAYLDDLRVRHIPYCHAPDSLTFSEISDSSVVVDIHDSWGTGIYQVVYSSSTSSDTVVVYGGTVTLTGLNHSSYYSVNVKGFCFDGSFTDGVSDMFSTKCRVITHDSLPYTETFDSYEVGGFIDPCWRKSSFDMNFQSYPILYHGVSYGGSDGASMLFVVRSGETAPYCQILVMPEMDYVNNVIVDFQARFGNLATAIDVGVMDSPDDVSTFFPIETVSPSVPLTWLHFDVPVVDYFGSGKYLAFGVRVSGTVFSSQIYIDDITIRELPRCSDSLSWLSASEVGPQCATLTWTASPALNDSVVYIVHMLDETDSEVVSDTTVSPEYYTCSLAEHTVYRAFVQLLCDGAVATVSDTVRFTTQCMENYVVNIGTSASYSTTALFPLGHNNLETEQLYRASQLQGIAGDITDIGLYMTLNTRVKDMVNCTVYMCHTSNNIMSEWIPYENMQKVYEGPFNVRHGWNTIPLSQPFHYNGTSNVVVAFVSGTDDIPSGIMAFAATYSFDTASLMPGSSGTTAVGYHNLLRISICPDVQNICDPPTITSISSTDMTVSVSYSPTPCEILIVRGWWNRGFSGQMDSVGSVTFENLEPSTQYTVGLRQHCDNGERSLWTIRRISTLPVEALPPVVMRVDNVGIDHASVRWNRRSSETKWELRLFNTVSDTALLLDDTAYTFGNLLPRVTYNVSIRSLCGSDFSIPSDWSDTLTFTTDYCHPVTSVTVNDITMTSALVSWTPSDNGIAWKVEYGYEGFDRDDALGSFIIEDATTVLLDSLEPGTSYNVFVAALCGPGMSSGWTGADLFRTLGVNGIHALPDGSGFVLYPNPASTTVTVRLDTDAPDARIDIIDQQGRSAATASGSVATIDVSGLSAGVYFVRLSCHSYSSIKKLIVK